MLFIYNLVLNLYFVGIYIAAVFNKKAAMWVAGRNRWELKLKNGLSQRGGKPLVWMHCASLGEFEQGRPVLEKIRDDFPDVFILLSFFSPSGYEIRKDYAGADFICYLPADRSQNAKKFVSIAAPDLVIFVKYEFWYHHLFQLCQKKIPLLLISGIFRPQQLFFKSYGKFFKKLLHCFSHLFVQEASSADLLRQHGISNVSVGGDTRVDRVAQIAETAKEIPLVKAFCGGSKVLVAGSTWPADENILLPFINRDLPAGWKVVLAPHQIKKTALIALKDKIELSTFFYSEAMQGGIEDKRVMIIDNVGMLASLYQYGTIAYIGGGFGAGIHNTLEPITFGLPVIFGPKYQKFTEALQLVREKGAFSIEDMPTFKTVFSNLQEAEIYAKASMRCKNYIKSNRGGTEKVLQYINEAIPLSPQPKTPNPTR